MLSQLVKEERTHTRSDAKMRTLIFELLPKKRRQRRQSDDNDHGRHLRRVGGPIISPLTSRCDQRRNTRNWISAAHKTWLLQGLLKSDPAGRRLILSYLWTSARRRGARILALHTVRWRTRNPAGTFSPAIVPGDHYRRDARSKDDVERRSRLFDPLDTGAQTSEKSLERPPRGLDMSGV